MQSKWRAYFELLRFPAVFTAVADVMMGYLVRNGDLEPTSTFALLLVASSSLYLAGMVFNDAFDADVDARERPERPIPSGAVTRSTAFRIGWILFVIGVAAAWTVELLNGDRAPLVLAVALATFIYLYDWEVKRYSIGPLNMGVCRMLNVLLGMSTVGIVDGKMTNPWTATQIFLAATMGVYVAGLTVFARRSNEQRSATTGDRLCDSAGWNCVDCDRADPRNAVAAATQLAVMVPSLDANCFGDRAAMYRGLARPHISPCATSGAIMHSLDHRNRRRDCARILRTVLGLRRARAACADVTSRALGQHDIAEPSWLSAIPAKMAGLFGFAHLLADPCFELFQIHGRKI